MTQAPGNKPEVAVTDSGLGEKYRPGDTARGYLVVVNNGNKTIDRITVTVTIYPRALFGLPAGHQSHTFNVGIAPGESRKIEYSQQIPSSVAGLSTRGHYRLEAKIDADGVHVTTLKRSVDVL